jgi:competence protein ComEC
MYYFLRVIVFNTHGDYIVFLSVGTGDSILLASRGRYLLIDGGPNFYDTNNVYKYSLSKKPSVYISTHYHSDHISGLVKATEDNINYDIFSNIQNHNTYQAKKLTDIALSNKYKPLYSGDKLVFENFTLNVLWPDHTCDNKNLNVCSVVLLVTHTNGKSVLLTSDSELEAQQHYIHQLGEVEILKVPHQGAADSLNPNMIEKLKPRVAIISVGKNNYGHPSPKTVSYLKSQGIKVYRTDKHGDIIVRFK